MIVKWSEGRKRKKGKIEGGNSRKKYENEGERGKNYLTRVESPVWIWKLRVKSCIEFAGQVTLFRKLTPS